MREFCVVVVVKVVQSDYLCAVVTNSLYWLPAKERGGRGEEAGKYAEIAGGVCQYPVSRISIFG
jgi:hypothetical protein